MKHKFYSFFVVVLFFTLSGSRVVAQTLHAIVACNTIDGSIGRGMVSDMRNMSNAIQTIAKIMNCDFEMEVFDGRICTKANITNYIKELEVESDDVVMFFYGGHGTHAYNNSSDPWPQMCMNTNIESMFMPVASVEKLIAAKNPRLRIIITNCCNKEQGGVSIKPLFAQSTGATMLSGYDASTFKKLFFESKGKVMMTSSKLGQYSWCNENGGVFTNDFIEVLDAVGKRRISDDWESVCNATKGKTFSKVFNDGVKQEPYYQVSVNGNRGKGNVPPPPTPTTDNLFSALQVMVSKNLSVDQRLGKMQGILSKYFTGEAKVVTVGRNGTSRVAYEDAEDFLRRLALSNSISQVNLLEGDKNGKNSFIMVHEVRN